VTRLTFHLSRSGNVSLSIVGVDGRSLRSIPAALYAPGTHSYEWDGRDDDGRPVAAGVYFAVARTPDGEKVTRIARIR
jgi:flagellar hook assembly protein FlgD